MSLTHQADDARLRIIAVDPFKSMARQIVLVERPFGPIDAIEIRNPSLNTQVARMLELLPFQLTVMRPFCPLSDLSTHEEEFFGRLRIHVPEQEPKVGKLLPVVPWHLFEQRTLPVHDFVMGQR